MHALMHARVQAQARFQRLRQDGVRSEVADLLEACQGGNDAAAGAAGAAAAKATCVEAAKERFEALSGKTGDEATRAFESEKRRGAGEKAGAVRKACLKTAATTAAEDECDASAKTTHEKSGGAAVDFW
jgi:hypothetical protein